MHKTTAKIRKIFAVHLLLLTAVSCTSSWTLCSLSIYMQWWQDVLIAVKKLVPGHQDLICNENVILPPPLFYRKRNNCLFWFTLQLAEKIMVDFSFCSRLTMIPWQKRHQSHDTICFTARMNLSSHSLRTHNTISSFFPLKMINCHFAKETDIFFIFRTRIILISFSSLSLSRFIYYREKEMENILLENMMI